jgi:hypothetical protein
MFKILLYLAFFQSFCFLWGTIDGVKSNLSHINICENKGSAEGGFGAVVGFLLKYTTTYSIACGVMTHEN